MALIEPIDPIVWPVLLTAEACLCLAWDDLPVDSDQRPGTCCIVAGSDLLVDDCCDGLAYVRVVRRFASTAGGFPAPLDQNVDNCPEMFWGVELGVGVIRCLDVGDGTAGPTCDQQREASALMVDDMARVLKAMTCCLRDSVEENVPGAGEVMVFVGQALPVGPQGGCVGFEQAVTVGLGKCVC